MFLNNIITVSLSSILFVICTGVTPVHAYHCNTQEASAITAEAFGRADKKRTTACSPSKGSPQALSYQRVTSLATKRVVNHG